MSIETHYSSGKYFSGLGEYFTFLISVDNYYFSYILQAHLIHSVIGIDYYFIHFTFYR